MELMLQVSKIEWKKKEDKPKEMEKLILMHREIQECGGIKLSLNNLGTFNNLMLSLNAFYQDKSEKLKRDSL